MATVMEEKLHSEVLTTRSMDNVNPAKSEFLAVMSHELRTPLNAILGMSQILQACNLGTEERDYVNTIFQAGSDLLLLIDDILAYCKLETGKFDIIAAPFDLRELIDEIVGTFAYQAREKDLALIVDYPPMLPHAYVGDSRRLRQILANLIGNAIKFTTTGHVMIRIECAEEEAEAYLLLKVIDTGIGIPEDKIQHIFERFTQVNSTFSRRYEGIGLGLSITKRLVELMGGEIGVESHYGEGSTFWCAFFLPLQQRVATVSAWEAYQNTINVLVIDDNAIRGSVLAKRVAPYRQNLVHGDVALDALLNAQQTDMSYHIAVIDQQLKTIDALQLAKAIKNNPILNHLLLILLTEPGREPNKETMVSHGFFSHINKLLSPPSFLQVLAKKWQNWLTETHPVMLSKLPANSHVLIIEDNLLNQQVAKVMLEKLNCQVEVVSNGVRALNLLERRVYNLVFVDLGLPDMDGLAVTTELRRREKGKRRTPLIAMVEHVFERDLEQCFAAGMDDIIVKPLLHQQLLILLKRWLPWGQDQCA